MQQPIPTALSYPPPQILVPNLSSKTETALKCFNSYYYELTTESTCFMPVYNSWSREIPHIRGGGQPIPAGLSYPPPKILDPHLPTSIETDLKCFNSYNDELTTESTCFMPVYNSWSREIPRISGWGATYPSWFILPPTQDFGSTSINKYWNCFKVL